MSLYVLGMAEEFAEDSIAFNALWRRTGIATAAIKLIGGEQMLAHCRKPEIVADAAHIILTKNSRDFTGHFCLDDVLLYEHGVTDFDQYAVDTSKELWPDFFVPDDVPPPGSMGQPRD